MKKVAFITGAGGFIGSETARTLARSGMAVAVCDINEETLKKTVDSIISEGGEVRDYVADVANSASIETAINQAYTDFGRLDAMIHVAGGSTRIAGKQARWCPLIEQEDYVIEKVIGVNLFGAIWSSRAAARIMIKQGQGGRIINFGSTVGVNGLACSSDYAAAKGGISSFTKALAKELGQYKITVNCVAPGVVMRPGETHAGDSERHYAYETNLLGEKCEASDIANMVDFLVSDKARFITGQTYVVDGGRSLSLKGTD